MLRNLAPNCAPYKTLNGLSLRTQLDKKYGVNVASTGNRHPIDPVAIREALAKWATADLDGRGLARVRSGRTPGHPRYGHWRGVLNRT
jgi:hypothetical protein